jgi:hypothetical protein
MPRAAELNDLILENVDGLTNEEKREVLNFIQYLKIKEDRSFIEYVNKRTEQALEAKRRGERFFPLDELQKDYG